MQAINQQSRRERLAAYRRNPFSLFLAALVTLSAVITLAVLVSLIIYILYKGIPNLKPSLFAWNYNTENVSMMPAIINTLSITAMTLLFSVPAGIFAAIYLVEYAKRGNKFVSVVRMTTETLAGIPSIVFGLFGYLSEMGLLHSGRRADAFYHGAAADFKNNGGSTPFRFGYLPRGQLRAWRREAENRISYCTAFRSAGDSGRGHSCHRAYRRGNGGSALSRRHSAAGGRWAVFLGAHAGGTHVCPPE